MLLEVGPNLNQIWPKSAKLVQVWPDSPKVGPMLAEFGGRRAKIAQNRSRSMRRATLEYFRGACPRNGAAETNLFLLREFLDHVRGVRPRTSADLAEFVQSWSTSGRLWPNPGQRWSIPADVLPRSGRSRADFGRARAEFDRFRTMCSPTLLEFGRMRARCGRIRGEFGRLREIFDRFRPSAIRLGPSLVHSGRFRARFGRIRGEFGGTRAERNFGVCVEEFRRRRPPREKFPSEF